MTDNQKITGKVLKGIGKGAGFVRLDWVQKECHKKVGFRPFPGTLNVEVVEQDLSLALKIRENSKIELEPPDAAFCCAQLIPVQISGINCAIVSPGEEVSVHDKKTLEILAPVHLKTALNIQDGDRVTLILFSGRYI